MYQWHTELICCQENVIMAHRADLLSGNVAMAHRADLLSGECINGSQS